MREAERERNDVTDHITNLKGKANRQNKSSSRGVYIYR